MKSKKLIVYELNEVPVEILDRYCRKFPNSSLNKIIKDEGSIYETISRDDGHLSPWVTWPTVHRGVTNSTHKITDLGQDMSEINKSFPTYYQTLAENGITVGIFGALHTYPMPKKLDNYKFYVPDTFAAGSETFPAKYKYFQNLNLSLTRKSGKNVSKKIPLKFSLEIFNFIFRLGITIPTFLKVLKQVLSEIVIKHRVVRRRTTQAQLSFDMYFNLLKTEEPQLSIFFTNHVASSLHRYWPASFPNDYLSFRMDQKWINKFKNEIWYTMKEADNQIHKIKNFIDTSSDNYGLIIISSMGQEPIQNSAKLENQLLLKNDKIFMKAIGIKDASWLRLMAMEPQYIFKFTSENEQDYFVEKIKSFKIEGLDLNYHKMGNNSVRIDLGHPNINKNTKVKFEDKYKDIAYFGFEVTEIFDKAGTYAYHKKEGLLLTYKVNIGKDKEILYTDQIAGIIKNIFLN